MVSVYAFNILGDLLYSFSSINKTIYRHYVERIYTQFTQNNFKSFKYYFKRDENVHVLSHWNLYVPIKDHYQEVIV